jgi:hypothetical protein
MTFLIYINYLDKVGLVFLVPGCHKAVDLTLEL